MTGRVLSGLLLVNLGPSLAVALFLTVLVAGLGPDTLPFLALIWLFVWAASSLAALLWFHYRRQARWNYLEGLLWGLLVFVLAGVPFLAVYLSQNPRMGMSLLEWLFYAAFFSSPMLVLVAPFVPLLWRRAAGGAP